MRTDWDVIVVGAGIAGLTAAAAAQREGARVLVLEAHTPGGRARCVDREGYTFNMGAHALYRAGDGSAVLRGLGVDPSGAPPPLRRYRGLADGRLHRLPTDAPSLLGTGLLGPRSKSQLVRLLGTLPRLESRRFADRSVDEFLAERRLREDAAAVVRALLRLGTYTADTAEFSADAAIAQLQIAARGGVRYLDGGWRRLVDSLASGLTVEDATDVTGLEPADGALEVTTAAGALRATRVVVAAGPPTAVARLLPAEPGWGPLGPPVTAACLDLGVREVPEPGYVLGIDEPLYATVQSPPARQAPDGHAVVGVLRYGARSASLDRPQLEAHARLAGVRPEAVAAERFLASMTVAGSMPRAATGGLAGRPGVEDSGVPGILLAGDWVGPAGLLADAALASGHAAGLLAARGTAGASGLVA